MADFTTTDYFSDESVAGDTYPYFDFLLDGRRVWREPYHGVVMVAGHEEVLTVLRDTASFSNCNIVAGPSFRFPVELTGDDVTNQVEEHRDAVPMSDQIITFDPPKHTAHRALLMGLITPKRLKENEEFMWRLADRQLDAVLPAGQCEFIDDFAQPYTLLVIADLLGVPETVPTPGWQCPRRRCRRRTSRLPSPRCGRRPEATGTCSCACPARR
jgi:cytochrome P450